MICFRYLLFALITISLAEARVFESTDGKTFEGDIVKVSDNTVKVHRHSDSREFEVPIERFSDSDQKYIAQWKRDEENRVKGEGITSMSR